MVGNEVPRKCYKIKKRTIQNIAWLILLSSDIILVPARNTWREIEDTS